ncbi:hypothetical protein TanjilG_16000 [Lupinus angustifolius]|uniref:Uncharacterized protein n=1 Tax=Lupinus angustifolius TaxID=3871 RepID=A0A4P1RGM4_LUPAN|nr:hypothetical protein TanjilG_16000 [Lupinus angustifolius]
MLTDLYASAGKWNSVIEMKSTIKDLILKKNPAMRFLSSKSSTDFYMLDELLEKLKTLGYNPETRFLLRGRLMAGLLVSRFLRILEFVWIVIVE